MEGLFILDKFDSGAMEETILAASPGAGWDMAEASAQCSQCWWRLLETAPGCWRGEDWFGTGETLTYNFTLGKEFPMVSSLRGEVSTGVISGEKDGFFVFLMKEKDSGAISEFKFTVDEAGLRGTWCVPASGQSSALSFQRAGDGVGCWRLLTWTEAWPTLLDRLGLDTRAKLEFQSMISKYSMQIARAGVWSFKAEKWEMEMVLGQEKTWDLAGRAAVELLTATQDGWQSILKLGDKTLVTRSKPGKTFKTVRMIIEGTDTAVTFFYIKE